MSVDFTFCLSNFFECIYMHIPDTLLGLIILFMNYENSEHLFVNQYVRLIDSSTVSEQIPCKLMVIARFMLFFLMRKNIFQI